MKKQGLVLWGLLIICVSLTACAGKAVDGAGADYGQIRSDFSGMSPELARAYLAVTDEILAHLDYDEAEGAPGEYLHGGFVRDWDGDGTQELCLLLKTSPRSDGRWDGTPIYGWHPPTLWLYTYQGGQALRAGACDLYFGTAGREAAVAARMTENGMQYVWWERSSLTPESSVSCFALEDGTVQKKAAPPDMAEASLRADTARDFLDALGTDKAQLLLYNNSGAAGIEGPANARELRAALADKAA